METTIRPLGNSDCIIFPKILLKEAGLSRGDAIEIKCDSESNIIISKANKRRSLAAIIGGNKLEKCRRRNMELSYILSLVAVAEVMSF